MMRTYTFGDNKMKQIYLHIQENQFPFRDLTTLNHDGIRSEAYNLEEHVLEFNGKKTLAVLKCVERTHPFWSAPRVVTFWNIPGYIDGDYKVEREGYLVPVTDIQTVPDDERESIERVLKAQEDIPVNFW